MDHKAILYAYLRVISNADLERLLDNAKRHSQAALNGTASEQARLSVEAADIAYRIVDKIIDYDIENIEDVIESAIRIKICPDCNGTGLAEPNSNAPREMIPSCETCDGWG